MRFLRLPRGEAADFSDNDVHGSLTRGIPTQVEPVAESLYTGHYQDDRRVRIQRYRCRSCQVMTHAEVLGGENESMVLVTTYERLRWKYFDSFQASSFSDDVSSTCPPPACFRDTRMEEVVLPRTSIGQREGMCYL
jgi:hypothetical protein